MSRGGPDGGAGVRDQHVVVVHDLGALRHPRVAFLMAKFVLTVEIDDDHLTESRMSRVGWAIGCAGDMIGDGMSFGDTWDGNSPPHLGGTSNITGSWYLQEF